ncbi:MAG: Gfo/Idh/MocA family oxidoreductase [Phycisphaerae bacterium]|nr:Gfo/Idh/MocA family oxidoreductase [Saprospiraceae bacterium]
MRVFNIGIIGYGGFGKFLHNAWEPLENVRVVAVADQNAAALQVQHGVKTFSDWRDLLREKDIDAIAIVTEPATHEEIATACMEAGKHVLIEKPLAISLTDAEKIIQTRDRMGTVAAIDFIMRFNPLLQAIQSFTQLGVFGKLRRADVENYAQDEQLPPEHWFWHPERSGGILIEHAVHFIDLVHFFAPAKILKVNGLKHNRNPQQEDQVMANVLYEGGLIATHYHSFARPGFFETTKIKLAYDLADIELQGWIPLGGTLKALVNRQTKQALLDSPFFELDDSTAIENASDESRPKGWGVSEIPGSSNRNTVRSGGIVYEVNEIVSGNFQMKQSKQEVYADCVRASLLDVLNKIENPECHLTASLETGLESLKVAVLATASARQSIASTMAVSAGE